MSIVYLLLQVVLPDYFLEIGAGRTRDPTVGLSPKVWTRIKIEVVLKMRAEVLNPYHAFVSLN